MADERITTQVTDRIQGSLDDRGRLPCKAAWALATEFEIPLDVLGRWADENEVKIGSCALGCFE